MKADIEKLFLDSLINSLPDNIYFKDRESRFLMVNRALAQRFGLKDPSEALGRTDADFFDEEHAQEARDDEIEVMETGLPMIGKAEHETTNDGDSRWVLTTKLPLYDTEGKMIGTFGVSRDVTEIKLAQQSLIESQEELRRHQDLLEETVRQRTAQLSEANRQLEKEVQERKAAEESLKLSEQRYRRLINVNPTYLYRVTFRKGSSIKTEHGEECLAVTGYSAEEYEANPNLWIIVVHPDDRALVKKFVTEDLTQRNHQNQIEHRILHKDGRVRWVRNTVVHHYDEEGVLARYDGLIEDITARKFADQRQKENERLSALSNMAHDVADNYARVIHSISADAGSLLKRLAEGTPLHKHAASISKNIEYAAQLNQRLGVVARTYGHKHSHARTKPVNIKKIVTKALKPYKKIFANQNIEVTTSIAPGAAGVNASAEQLLDTLSIMFSNAADAMPTGGTLTITATTKKILRSSHRWNQISRGGTYTILRITDNGAGMDKDTADKVFDSFFTTKTEQAFGLGLPMAEAAVRSWGGWIRVRSRPGEGTTFRIFIPVSKEEVEAAAETPKKAVRLKGKTALVIDDNEKHAETICAALQAEGMNTLKAHNDAAAIDTFAANIDKISLCVLDMILDDGDWGKTLTQIYDLKPEANVIVISGFSRDFVRSHLPMGAWTFLQKPIDSPALLKMASELIGRGSS